MSTQSTKRVVRDFWHALKVSFYTGLISFVGLYVVVIKGNEEKLFVNPFENEETLFMIIFIISSFLMIWVYFVYIQGVALKNEKFSWPASDVENSFLDLITLKRLRGLFYRESVNALDIEYVTNDFGYKGEEGSKKRIYSLNISGSFGSRNIRFNSKQKRDEARNILKSFSKTKIEADIAFN
jgi:hypothetical protein